MKSFTYTIVDPVGIHARPAGLLVKTAKAFSGTEISVTKGDKTVKSTQLMKLMGLGGQGRRHRHRHRRGAGRGQRHLRHGTAF